MVSRAGPRVDRRADVRKYICSLHVYSQVRILGRFILGRGAYWDGNIGAYWDAARKKFAKSARIGTDLLFLTVVHCSFQF